MLLYIFILLSLVVSCSSATTIVDLWGITDPKVLLSRALDVMQNDSSTCVSHLSFYLDNMMSSEWAMTMFDSSTKIPESVLMLQLMHLGNFDECLSVKGVLGPANDTFDAQHCLASFAVPLDLLMNPNAVNNHRVIARQFQLPDEIMELQEHRPQGREAGVGLVGSNLQLSYCLPSSCKPEILQYFFNETISNISQQLITVPGVMCSQGSRGRSLHTEDWIAVLALTLGLICMCLQAYCGQCIIASERLDIEDKQKQLPYLRKFFLTQQMKTILTIFGCLCIISTCYDLLTENKRKELLTAFSWYSNGQKLLATSDSSSDTLHALHGIRFISMCWVVLGHSHGYDAMASSINLRIVDEFLRDFWRLYLTNAMLSVDTFFVLSGLLVSYVFLKQMNKSKNSSFNIPLYYFHRYIRLTPPYAIMIMIQATLIRYMGAGPLYDAFVTITTAPCRTHWWTQLLYVNNYVETTKMCLGQGWYLAVDMQLFILSPIVLIPLWKWSRNLSLSFLGILVLCGLATAFSVSQIKEFPASMIDAIAQPDVQRLQYLPTHTRFTPWLIGIITGYLIYETKRRKITICKVYALFGWLIGAGALLGSLLGMYPFYKTNAHQTQLENSLYTTFSRPVWSLGVAWVAFACVSGVGGPVNTFLSWKVFQPLSRLTYCVYLVHMSWQLIRAASVKTSTYLGDIVFIPTFISDLIISFLLAVILSLCFESPVIILEKTSSRFRW